MVHTQNIVPCTASEFKGSHFGNVGAFGFKGAGAFVRMFDGRFSLFLSPHKPERTVVALPPTDFAVLLALTDATFIIGLLEFVGGAEPSRRDRVEDECDDIDDQDDEVQDKELSKNNSA